MDDNEEEEVAEHNQIDFDKRSVVSNKTIKSLVSKKKDKIKLKRQFLLKRKIKTLCTAIITVILRGWRNKNTAKSMIRISKLHKNFVIS